MRPGDIVSNKYRLHCRLARGGMGEVWAGRNVFTERDVAVKILREDLAANREAVRRFLQEARATGQLQHPSLVHVFDAGVTRDDRPFLVMELLYGESLEDRLDREGRLDQLATCVILSQVGSAAQLAHEAGIVHRDLSSANIFLSKPPGDSEPTPKILDFGISKIVGSDGDGRVRTADGTLLGSPAFMSPEQAEGRVDVDARADVWSLGVLLYLCLTGRTPFDANNPNALMLAVIMRSHPPLAQLAPWVEPELAELAEHCLLKDCSVRLPTAREFTQRLVDAGRKIARRRGASALMPQRRATDRLSAKAASALIERRGGARGVAQATTGRVRARRWWLRRPLPRTWLAAASALLGLGLGVLVGIHAAARSASDAAPKLAAATTGQERVSSSGGESPRGSAPVASAAAAGEGNTPEQRESAAHAAAVRQPPAGALRATAVPRLH